MIAVITSIQPPTDSVRALVRKLDGEKLIVVGDFKSPPSYPVNGVDFIRWDDEPDFDITNKLHTNSYPRKNLGYLLAMRENADAIYETDDDNTPMVGWQIRKELSPVVGVEGVTWVNIYRRFTESNIWPRGFPVYRAGMPQHNPVQRTDPFMASFPVQQCLANGDPDVDAIYRMVFNKDTVFNVATGAYLEPFQWCPINSQNTWWFKSAYHLMYLPSTCSFRATDIWRGFVAQRCLWADGHKVAFFTADMFQERNPHNINDDFNQEVGVYLNAERVVDGLSNLKLRGGDHRYDDMVLCYEQLDILGVITNKEAPLLEAWINDCKNMGV